MSTATLASSIVVDVAADNALAARLIHPRADVVRALGLAITKGEELRATRIRYQEDLDEARAKKLQWTQASIDLLSALFDNTSVADYCNDWVGKIFPEYAEFGNFVEQFYEEMEHRVGKLRSVLARVEQVPDTTPAVIAAPAPIGDAPAAPAPTSTAPAKGVVTHPATPIAMAHVAILGAPATDSTHSAATEFLKQLGIATKSADDAAACDASTGAAVLILPSQPADPMAERAVLFKLGCAVGRLGANRVCVLHAPGVTPIAEGCVTHVAIDPAGAWHLLLARQLKLAGMHVDLNRLC